MVRIAVRTLTLNVYKGKLTGIDAPSPFSEYMFQNMFPPLLPSVSDPAMLEYICNKTAAPYFSNLVWFIGNHIIELDECLLSQAQSVTHLAGLAQHYSLFCSASPPSSSRLHSLISPFFTPHPPSSPLSHLNRGRLEQLVAEHLDHLHYISDILSLDVAKLNEVITDHFLSRLLIPLYVYSLADVSPHPEGVRHHSVPSVDVLAADFVRVLQCSLKSVAVHLSKVIWLSAVHHGRI